MTTASSTKTVSWTIENANKLGLRYWVMAVFWGSPNSVEEMQQERGGAIDFVVTQIGITVSLAISTSLEFHERQAAISVDGQGERREKRVEGGERKRREKNGVFGENEN
ncbi:hypothetical protein TIFTF001_033832 [Ficus carica]|uniref:Uncharacterized protein n=1 Tax=Ficus carica TaxID=3494 RepID=A0AA88DYV0_FICCA|nr:hypothetical protein TIFTF001_033832 [Ficus carica]